MINQETLAKYVNNYSCFGDHRTGTLADQKTLNWFAERIIDHGGTVQKEEFIFSMFEANAELTIDGTVFDTLPLFYSATGTYSNIPSRIVEIDVTSCDDDEAINTINKKAKAAEINGDKALIISTNSLSGGLYAINIPNSQEPFPTNIPILLSPFVEDAADRSGSISLSSKLTPKTSTSIVGQFGCNSSIAPLVITTPLSGWFSCAGERGAGIAIALAAAEHLAPIRPVILIGTSGHELGHLGAQKICREGLIEPTWPVLHIGSCVGASVFQKDLREHILTDLNIIFSLPDKLAEKLSEYTQHLSISLHRPENPANKNHWQGESKDWANTQRSMVSVAGASSDFHCKSDLPETVRPERVREAALMIAEIGTILCDGP